MFTKLFLIFPSIVNIAFGMINPPNLFKRNLEQQSRISVDDVECDNQLNLFSEAMLAREMWALRLFDTWGKIPSGLFERNQFSLGRYSECMKFRHDTQSEVSLEVSEAIQGQYCLVGFVATPDSSITNDSRNNVFDWREIGDLVRNQNMLLLNGICLPETCSHQKVANFLNPFLLQADLYTFPPLVRCQTNEPPPIKVVGIIAIVIYSFFAFLVIASSIYDMIKRYAADDPHELLISFSAYTNGKQLFNVTRSNSSSSLNCLNGLRSISLMWIIFGHRFSNQQIFPMTNPQALQEHFNHIYSVIFSSHNIAVDTFFVMGALLLTTSILKSLDKNRLNIPRMILHRYLRYTPVLAALILLIVSLSKFAISGPINIDIIIEQCESYWWLTLLHIQNYVYPNDQCASHAWYLAADFQLFIISPFLIYPAWKYGWKYLWTLPALAIISSIYILIMCLVYDLRVFSTSPEQADIYGQFIYFPTHARLGPWMIGIVLGYVMHKSNSRDIKIGKTLNSILWILALSILTTVTVIIHPMRIPFNQSTLLHNAMYHAFHRLAWSSGIFWIIFACEKLKTGGIIGWFLSLPQWQPIARMSLSMYLVHPIYQYVTMANQKEALTFEIMPMMHSYWGDILVTIFLGTILYLTFETPFLLVEKYFYNKRNSKEIIISK